MRRTVPLALALALGLTGCAPQWTHTVIEKAPECSPVDPELHDCHDHEDAPPTEGNTP